MFSFDFCIVCGFSKGAYKGEIWMRKLGKKLTKVFAKQTAKSEWVEMRKLNVQTLKGKWLQHKNNTLACEHFFTANALAF